MRLEQPILAMVFIGISMVFGIVDYYVITAEVYSLRQFELIGFLSMFGVITLFMGLLFAKVDMS